MDNSEDWKPYTERKVSVDNETAYKVCELLGLDIDRTHSIFLSAEDMSVTICELTDEAYKAIYPDR